jgi:threonine dehydratase
MKAVATDERIEYRPIPLDEVKAAQERTKGIVLRTPLVKLDYDDAPCEIFLKLECLQPIRSFKLRGASNAMLIAGREALAEGIWTGSAGNMAQGAAWAARAIGVDATVYVPNTAPRTKIEAVRRYGGRVVELSVEDWFAIFRNRDYPGAQGVFVHPYSDPGVMAGNGVIGLEIVEDLPDVDAVIVPWGGGGLCCGIASAIKALKPECKVYACEIETGAPLAPSLEAGHPVEVPFTPSFVDGIGSPFVNQEMFDLAVELIDGSLVVSLKQTADALRLIIERNRAVPEGAGAVATAAALDGMAGSGKVACLVSGGNIDPAKLVTILEGGVPG